MPESFLEERVTVLTGDITTQNVDAIVNAANVTLLGGGGVDGAIHRAGGPKILAECQQIRETTHPQGLPTGQAVITSGGKLRAKYVIHTVGPIYGHNPAREAKLLANCYQNSLRLAAKHGCSSIAFPAISTGVFGYPKKEAAEVSSRAIKDFLTGDKKIREVRLVFFNADDAQVFLKYQKF